MLRVTTGTKTVLHQDKSSDMSSTRTRSRRQWPHSRTGTAVVAALALLLSTSAWLSLVFSGATSRCWHRFKDRERRPRAFSWGMLQRRHDHSSCTLLPPASSPSPPSVQNRQFLSNASRSPSGGGLSTGHLVFGIAGSSHLWKRRKELVRLWWRPDDMRGHVWLEEWVSPEEGDDSLPGIMVSEDISSFRYTNPVGHPSGLRISRIVTESFRLGLPDVRWFVLGDDDTIFNVENLVAVLSKYDPSEMVYIGAPSESHYANSHFSHYMAFGGGGIAISYPLAGALSKTQDGCLERYPKLFGSDDRLHACITELGIPLKWEHGFHQWDIKGNALGLLSAHPIAPFVSIHHVQKVAPFFPGLSPMESLKRFTRAMKVDPRSFLQRSICYDHARRLTFSVSLGYVVQVFPRIVFPRELERSEHTYSPWLGVDRRKGFDLDIRDPYRSVCRKPIRFFLKEVGRREGNATLGSYERARGIDDLKRKIFCFGQTSSLQHVESVSVLGYPLRKNWHLAPRRMCCKPSRTSDELLELTVMQCDKGSLSSFP